MGTVVRYETTEIEPTQSANEIAELVREHGGSSFELLWDREGNLKGVRFSIYYDPLGELPIFLDANSGEIERRLRESGKLKYRDREAAAQKARMVAWRILKYMIEQILLAVEYNVWDLVDVFAGGVETWDPQADERVTLVEYVRRHGRYSHRDRSLHLGGPSDQPLLTPPQSHERGKPNE